MSEDTVIRCCAPTLAAIKTGSLFSCSFENREDAQRETHDELIRKDGIYKSFVEGRQEAASWKIA